MTTEATTELGTAHGIKLDNGIAAFLGLPFAQPTSGSNRFGPPAPVRSWGTDPLDATEVGPPPPQFPHERLDMYPAAGENCLWLNVWTPSVEPDAQRPVMVWIHGGGWLQESAADPVYFGDELAARGDVVVVSIEYRSNVFGFSHIESIAGSGNAGLLDQVAALHWVREHIAAFGGDPSNVTIFGESAGGMSTSALLGMPRAKGLFHRAIMQSNVASTVRRTDFASAITAEIARRATNRPALDELALDLMRNMEWERLLEVAVAVADESLLSSDVIFGPVHDHDVFPETPLRATAGGLNASIPIMLGFTRHESRYWYDIEPMLAHPDVTEQLVLGAMVSPALPDGATIDELASLLRELEPEMSRVQVGLAGLDDAFFRQPVLRQAEAHDAPGHAGAYVYRFDWPPQIPREHGFDYGSPHAADLAFTIGNAAAYPEMYGTGVSEPLQSQMMDAWISFARTGDPNHPSLPDWPPYERANRATMVFDANGHPTSHVELDPDPQRRDFWADVPFDGLRPAFTPRDLPFER